MATYKLGKTFSFKWNNLPVVCKVSANFSVTNEGIIIRNDCTGDWGVPLEGGDKSGTVDATFDIDFAADGVVKYSFFDLLNDLGKSFELLFGDETAGEKYMTFQGRLDSLTNPVERNTQLQCSATWTIGQPTVVTSTP